MTAVIISVAFVLYGNSSGSASEASSGQSDSQNGENGIEERPLAVTPTAVPTDVSVTTPSPEPSPTATSSPTATPVLVFIDSMWLGRVEASIYAASSKLFMVYDIVIDSQQIIVLVEHLRDD